MVAITSARPAASSGLRPLDLSRDISAVADLVEMCFMDTMDADGERYLRQMRDSGHNATLMRWAGVLGDQDSQPLNGFVWEEHGRLVGNVSVIPFYHSGQRHFLIANVAVHPDFRSRGIGRGLTAAAMDYIRSRRLPSAWLHVRQDNDVAHGLYLSLGFQERARRTTWQASGDPPSLDPQVKNRYILNGRRPDQWALQSQWLQDIYPAQLSWHLPFNLNALRPGLVGELTRFFMNFEIAHWSVQNGNQLVGVLSWQRYTPFTDCLWLAIPPKPISDNPEVLERSLAIHALLIHARQNLYTRRILSLEFPAHIEEQAIRAAGFKEHQTLIWMEARFK